MPRDLVCAIGISYMIDWFKSVNDRFGHLSGDQVPRRVVDRMREFSRDSDMIGRYGGEEFVLLMQGADEHAGARPVERVRGSISRTESSSGLLLA